MTKLRQRTICGGGPAPRVRRHQGCGGGLHPGSWPGYPAGEYKGLPLLICSKCGAAFNLFDRSLVRIS